MADELKTKKITDLEENTTIDDTDILMAGDKGTNALKRFTVAKLFDAIKTKIAGWAFDTLTTTDKTLPGAVNELNSNLKLQMISDANNAVPQNEKAAFYELESGAHNTPYAGRCYVMVFGNATTHCAQICYSVSEALIYYRLKQSGVWREWRKITYQ